MLIVQPCQCQGLFTLSTSTRSAANHSAVAMLLAVRHLARWLLAPQELPVGVLTAALGGTYLLWLMHRRTSQGGVL